MSDEPQQIKITSNGDPFATCITQDGKPITNVVGLRWELGTDGTSRMILDCDWVDVEYEGPYVQNIMRPTLREALGIWWRGRTRPNRDQL
jgi:hypothetical protein